MINAQYLENLARHRFGVSEKDEKYIDKFVDMRLRLSPRDGAFEEAVVELALDLPLQIPFGEDPTFGVEAAAKLAGKLAVDGGLSMRKVKRLILRVELAMRCYGDRPLDAPLLVLLAFHDEGLVDQPEVALPRSSLTPEEGKKQLARIDKRSNLKTRHETEYKIDQTIRDNFPEMIDLSRDVYNFPDQSNYKTWAQVFQFLAPHYIPSHRDILNSVASVVVDD